MKGYYYFIVFIYLYMCIFGNLVHVQSNLICRTRNQIILSIYSCIVSIFAYTCSFILITLSLVNLSSFDLVFNSPVLSISYRIYYYFSNFCSIEYLSFSFYCASIGNGFFAFSTNVNYGRQSICLPIANASSTVKLIVLLKGLL